MANKLVFRANFLNQCLNSAFIGFRFPLKWSLKRHCWYLYKPKTFLENFYLKIAVIKLGSTAALFAPFLWQILFPQNPISKIRFFVAVMTFILVVATSIVDLLCYLNISELLLCSNWSYDQIGKRSNSKNTFLQDFEIKQGVLALSFVFGFTTLAFLASIGLVYSELDPIFTIANIVLSVFKLELPNFILFILKMIRYALTSYVALLSVTSFRTMSLCGIIGGFYKGKLLYWMSRQTLSFPVLKFYRQAVLTQKMLYSVEYKISTATFGLAFGVILFGVYVCILGQFKNIDMLTCVGAIGISGGCAFLQFTFMVGSAFYENSFKALQSWQIDLCRNGSSRYLRRLLRSLKPVAMPAGEVGIIDKDIKINYSDKLLGYIVDVVVWANQTM